MSAPVIMISHGFQQDYERGFVNGVAGNGVAVCLIGSDETDAGRLAPGVEVRNLRGSQSPDRSRLRKALNIVRYYVRLLAFVAGRRGAVIHVIGQFRGALLLAILECLCYRLLGRRFVLTVHNLLPHNRHGAWERFAYGRIWRIPERLVVHTARMKLGLVEQFGVPAERIAVMDHGIEEEAPAVATAVPLPADIRIEAEIRLLFFGMVSPYKGLDVLLRTFEMLDARFGLLVAGRCVIASYAAEIDAAIARSPNRARIRWLNRYIGEGELRECFLASDAVMLPYRHIDQSGVLFQAMRFGTPVIATRVGSLADYVTSDIGIMVERAEPELLRDGLLRFADTRGTFDRTSIARRGRDFLWSNTVRAVLPVYA